MLKNARLKNIYIFCRVSDYAFAEIFNGTGPRMMLLDQQTYVNCNDHLDEQKSTNYNSSKDKIIYMIGLKGIHSS